MSLSISSTNAVSPTAWLSKTLQADGLSSAKAKTAAADLLDAAETSLAANPDESEGDFRAALDKRIDADVKSGTLSQDDADKVTKALDQVDEQDGGAAEASGGAAGTGEAGAAPAGGSGGVGSSEKAEVSRTVTVSGDTKTIVITYDDGTSETETATATTADHQKYDKKAAANDAKAAQDYLAQTPPGTLVDKAA